MSVLENFRASVLGLAAGACLASGALAASPAKLALAHQRLELPGVPVQTLAVDLDRDGLRDLAVVVASTSWGEVGIEEPMQVDDEGTFVDVLTVVPTVLDRRELLLFLGAAAGAGGFGSAGYAAEPVRFELPSSVHAIAAGPPAAPLVAWTDDGIAADRAGELRDGRGPDHSRALPGAPHRRADDFRRQQLLPRAAAA